MTEEEARTELAKADYHQVESIKNDARWKPYYQRWEGPRGKHDWYEFPHDAPLALVWDVIHGVLVNPPPFLAERQDGM